MKRSLSVLFIALALAGCSTFRTNEPLPSASRVDLDQFLGRWYVIASMPSAFDSGAHNSLQVIRREDRGFHITYQFNVDAPDGELRAYGSSANVTNPGINTEWKVRVTWPFNTIYQIIEVADDYSYALIGHPDRSNAWILSRTPSIDAPIYSDMVMRLQGLGYNIGRLRTVQHN